MNNHKSIKKHLTQIFIGLISLVALGVSADDTEVFYTESEVNSNVLFIMDNSGSMKEKVDGTDSTGMTLKKSFVSPANKRNTVVQSGSSSHKGDSNGWSIYLSNWWTSGVRFPDIDIPRNAQITKAYIQLTASYSESDLAGRSWAPVLSRPLTIEIRVEDTTNPKEYKSSYRNLRNKTWSNEQVEWDVPVFSARYAKYNTPNLTELVQKIVSKGSWSKGKAMSFLFKRSSGTGLRYAYSRRPSDDYLRPRLFIEYVSTGGKKTRMQIMQSALRTVLENAPSNLSVGIMNYGDTTGNRRNYPNGVKFPTKSVNSLARPIVETSLDMGGVPNWAFNNIPEPEEGVTVRTFLSQIADNWEPKGMTPIVDALYEAALYYRGDPMYFGYDRSDRYKYAAHPSTYTKPAPAKVEPVTQKNEKTVCGRTSSKTIYDYAWDDRLTRWLNGDTENYKCPADPNNPSEATSSSANCAATKYNCGTSDPYRDCNDWVDGYYTPWVCTGPADEDGNPTNCNRNWVDGYCRNNDWGDWVTESWCKFKVCATKYTPIPAPEYKTPVVDECQSNNIILMSDGKPEYTSNSAPKAYWKIRSLMGNASCDSAPFGFKAGRCGKELTHYLADNDINSGLVGDQRINTFVIGFSSGITANAENYLKSLVTVKDDPETADKKEGYFSAQNEAELAEAFQTALEDIAQEARSQASPGYSVNVKSGLEHEDDIYIPVFDKTSGATWSGNLKKFKLVNDNGHRFIRGKVTKDGDSGANGYIDAMTELGLFKDSAWDEWSQSEIPDGNDVAKGGTASLLDNPRTRKLYTNVASNDLSHPNNFIRRNNNRIKQAMLFDKDELGLNNTDAKAYRKTLLNYIRGWLNGDDGGWGDGIGHGFPEGNIPAHARLHMGDMLHSEPVVITFDDGGQYIFAATNEGYLHAFDTKTGEEKWAFMPKALLKNIHPQFVGTGKHVYGIDGPISYFKDKRTNKVYLYFGLRRGGRAYYALEITNPLKPKLLWKKDNTDLGDGLGQSWSMPYIANVKYNNEKIPAVIFTGGHDVATDYEPYENDQSVMTDVQATMGNNIFILNAVTGEKLWDMRNKLGNIVNHSIPGGARILDVDRNGLLDRLYFSDTGGNVWRLDLDESLGDESKLKKIAKLGGEGASSRKFYNEPDVAMLQANGKTIFTVSVGSGIRPHPLNDVIDDKMFILLDKQPYGELKDADDETYFPITMSDLANVEIGTSVSNGVLTKSIDNDELEGKKITQTDKKGWYISFPEDGEKVLAPSITFEGSIIFTTLVPKVLTTGELISACAAPATQGRLYALDILEAESTIDQDQNDAIDNNDVFNTISASEIPGTPQQVFNKLECDGDECTHEVDIRIGKKSSEVGSANVAKLESIYWGSPEKK